MTTVPTVSIKATIFDTPTPTPTLKPVTPTPTSTPRPALNIASIGTFENIPAYNEPGTAQNTLVLYIDYVYKHDYESILKLRLPTWVQQQNDAYSRTGVEWVKPLNMVKTMYEYEYIEKYEVLGYSFDQSDNMIATVKLYDRYPTPTSDLETRKLTVTLTAENGKFYVADWHTEPWQ